MIYDCTRCVLIRYFDMSVARWVLRPVPHWLAPSFPYRGSTRWEETRAAQGGDQVNVIVESSPVPPEGVEVYRYEETAA